MGRWGEHALELLGAQWAREEERLQSTLAALLQAHERAGTALEEAAVRLRAVDERLAQVRRCSLDAARSSMRAEHLLARSRFEARLREDLAAQRQTHAEATRDLAEKTSEIERVRAGLAEARGRRKQLDARLAAIEADARRQAENNEHDDDDRAAFRAAVRRTQG